MFLSLNKPAKYKLTWENTHNGLGYTAMGKNPVTIRYRFEKHLLPPASYFECFAETAYNLVHNLPLAVPKLPLGIASRINSDILTAFPKQSESKEMVRLKAIESSTGTLLEHFYNADGHLIKTVYPDRESVKYQWDDTGQLIAVYMANKIIYEYRKEAQVETITYSDNKRFLYRYDINGQLKKCVFPDQTESSYAYDSKGRILGISCADSRFSYMHDKGGILTRTLFKRQNKNYELSNKETEIAFNLDKNADVFPLELSSALGLWKYAFDESLQEMMLPNGQRLHLESSGNKKLLWSSQGQETYEYSTEGTLAAVLHLDGTRTVFQRLPKTRNVYAVNPNGVILYQYDKNGKLRKKRDDKGRYAIFNYNRDGMVRKIVTESGNTQFKYDNAGKLIRIKLLNGFSAKLHYDSTPYPISVTLYGIEPDALSTTSVFNIIMWQWMALKSMFRLDDPELQEV